MGKGKQGTRHFTSDDLMNRSLVINMLKYEEKLTKSEYGQSLYKNPSNNPIVSLTVEKILNRLTLLEFGFNSTDEDVEMYRKIFRTYYKSPVEYDEEVLNSVHYMRENKCVYYTSEIIKIGDIIPNCELFQLDGINKDDLYNVINQKNYDYIVIAGFSLS